MAFGPQTLRNSFGEYIAELGLTQLRIAETEKYAHVTYFFNGGVESAYPGEDRILVPSPKVATYDLKPEMSALEVTDKLVAAIASGKYDAIVCNYANGDMVGHTGNLEATVKAVETLDACIGRVVAAARAAGGEVLITADHGNAEKMHDEATGQAHTAHTLYLVPFVYVGRPATLVEGRIAAGHRADPARADGIAATPGNDRQVAGAPRETLRKRPARELGWQPHRTKLGLAARFSHRERQTGDGAAGRLAQRRAAAVRHGDAGGVYFFTGGRTAAPETGISGGQTWTNREQGAWQRSYRASGTVGRRRA